MKRVLIAYTRVSTKEQGTSGNGLDAQRAAIEKFAQENDCILLDTVVEVASGGLGLDDRAVLRDTVKRALKMGATLVVSKLDRLSRDASFILNLMNTKLKFAVVQHGFSVDEFTLHLYAVLGEKERKMIGTRTKEALAMLKANGVKLGNPTNLQEAAQKGAAAVAAKADGFSDRMRGTISMMQKAGMSFSAMARQLNETGTKTARGGLWAPQTVKNLVERLNR